MKTELIEAIGEESADEIVHQLTQQTAALNIVMPETVADCMNRVTFLANRQFTDAAEMGFILLNVKAQVPHGQYTSLLKDKGIHVRLARRAVAVAKMLLALPKGKTDKLSVLNMNQHQLSELSAIPIETLKELDDEDYEVLAETSGNAIKKQVAELLEKKSELEDSQAELINELEQERLRKT
ncbi:hypothetical protein, partial [Pseudoalteromonas rubra]|uniref:hypothetical protein n=1 Tax=Pseudoalteromonas rubra TaxID=43658 RepID=UPI002DBE5EF2